MGRRSWIGFVVVLGLWSIAAIAADVRVNGTTLVFDAKIGEVNRVTINTRDNSVFDPATGQFLTGVTITDIGGSALTVQAPCRKVFDKAFCSTDVTLLRAEFLLGNKDDTVTEVVPFGATSLPMTVEGGLGNDTITGSPDADTLDGGDGNDIINGGLGNDVIRGGLGDDTLTGGPGRDNIDGNAGSDTINAQDGDVDTINCGIGIDKPLVRDPGDTFSRCER